MSFRYFTPTTGAFIPQALCPALCFRKLRRHQIMMIVLSFVLGFAQGNENLHVVLTTLSLGNASPLSAAWCQLHWRALTDDTKPHAHLTSQR